MSTRETSVLVTVAIPTRNRSRYLVNAVKSALAQTYTNIEVVVSDNASTDDTALCMCEITDPRLVFLRQTENLGMIGNFNACLQAATGELFLMLSDDDLLEPDAIERLSKPFLQAQGDSSGKEIGLTWCPCVTVDSNGVASYCTDGGPEIESIDSFLIALLDGKRGPRFCSVMVQTADAHAVGDYNGERYGALCDTANWALAALRHPLVSCIDSPLVKNMVHPASASSRGNCRNYQAWATTLSGDLRQPLRARGVSERELRAMNRNYIAAITMTILLPNIGQPGWITFSFREVIRVWRSFLTISAARRLFFQSHRVFRLWYRTKRT